MNDDTKELKTVEDQSETRPLAVSDKPIPASDDVPLYVTDNDLPRTEQLAAEGSSPSAQPQSVANPDSAVKHGISTLTVIFGLLGVLVGALGLVFGVTFPDMPIAQFTADPQVLVAIICALGGCGFGSDSHCVGHYGHCEEKIGRDVW